MLRCCISLLLLCIAHYSAAQSVLNHEQLITNSSYRYKEVSFVPKVEKFKMYGTLIMPGGHFTNAVIIVPGTGMDTRNSHYKLAEELLKNNIAVFRYDDRGVADSGGRYNRANNTVTMLSGDLRDCLLTLRSLPELTGKKIGLLGHSEGGMVTIDAFASGAAADFLVQIATPVIKHGEFIKYQLSTGQNNFNDLLIYDTAQEKLAVMSALHQVVADNKLADSKQLHRKLDKKAREIGYDKTRYTRFPYLTLVSELDLVKKDFESTYRNIPIPLLYLIGTNDTYVDPVHEPQMLRAFGNKNITVIVLPDLNHYLSSGKLSIANLYDIDASASTAIFTWINAL